LARPARERASRLLQAAAAPVLVLVLVLVLAPVLAQQVSGVRAEAVVGPLPQPVVRTAAPSEARPRLV